MIGPELWREFDRDPRSPDHAPMRASDADREIVLRALGDAYAEGRLDREEYDERADAAHTAKTLGELPGYLDDLVPTTGLVPLTGSAVDLRSVDEQAVARWEKSRGEAVMGFLIPTLICWVVWVLTMPGGFLWPVFPTIATAIPVARVLVQRKEIIESNKRRIQRRQEKALRKQQRRELPPPGSS